jgi:hypothetical protein
MRNILFFLLSWSLPVTALAAGINLSAIKPYSDGIINLINNILVPIIIAIAFIVFLWGVFKYYVLNGANDSERAKGHQFILWGLIGLTIIFVVWGLVNLVASIFSLTPGGSAPKPPTF